MISGSRSAQDEKQQGTFSLRVTYAVLILVLLAAFGFRLVYAFDMSPFSDEYITMLAARAVLETGLPILPSGFFYDHGILFVYLDALFLGLMGFSEDIARVASVFVGLLTLSSVFLAGRRWFSLRVGLLAALMLALMPETVIWQGRARMYVLLQLLFWVGAFLLYESVVEHDRRLWRCVGIVALVGAMLSHLLAVPYTATLLLGLAVARWRAQRRGAGFRLVAQRLWPESALAAMGLGLVMLTRWLGGPWGAGGRIVTDPAVLADVGYLVTHVMGWMHVFLIWPNLIWTAMILVGVLALLLRLARKAGQRDDLRWGYLLIIWLGSVVGLGVFSLMYADSYVFGLLPFFCLLSARELDGMCDAVEEIMERPGTRRTVAWASTAVVAGLVVILTWPGTLETLIYDPLQLEQALGYVHERWQEGDTIATFAPPASLITLGQVDFCAQEGGCEAVETDAGRVDIWTGSPEIDSAEELYHLLDTSQRVWLLVYRDWWEQRYSISYRQRVEERMNRVFDGTGTLVYLSKPQGAKTR